MQKRRLIRVLGGAFSLALVFAAQAQNNRSFVATTGLDSNNCSATAYCRTFGRALAQTNSGGEIVVVNSGGYGPVTITQPVDITAIGIDASITALPANNAITINTSGNVTINGLNLHGQGTAIYGVTVQQVGVLRLYNMLIEGFSFGVDFEIAGNLEIDNAKINDSHNAGLMVNNTSANVYVHSSSFDGNFVGVSVDAGLAAVADSSAEFNSADGFVAPGGTLALFNDRAVSNGTGVSTPGGAIFFADCLLANNTSLSFNAGGGSMDGTTPGTSMITPGQGSSGGLGAITLK